MHPHAWGLGFTGWNSGRWSWYPAARFWTEPLDERFTKIGTYEVYRVKCNLVNGLPPRYRGE
jgi:hypothetical protein